MLLSWDAANQENGLEAANIQVHSGAEYVLALESGQFDLYFGPAPSAAIARPTMWVVPRVASTGRAGGDLGVDVASTGHRDRPTVQRKDTTRSGSVTLSQTGRETLRPAEHPLSVKPKREDGSHERDLRRGQVH